MIMTLKLSRISVILKILNKNCAIKLFYYLTRYCHCRQWEIACKDLVYTSSRVVKTLSNRSLGYYERKNLSTFTKSIAGEQNFTPLH